MAISTLLRAVRQRRASLLRAALGALSLAGLGLSGAPAAADGPRDIYLSVETDDRGRPFSVFVFSDGASSSFQPTDATAIWLARPFEVGVDRLDPRYHCGWNFDFPTEIPAKFKETPIYGPNSEQQNIGPFDLSIFMGREVARLMIAEEIVEEKNAGPYLSCTAYVWSLLLNQPPGVWRDIINEAKKEQGLD